MTRNRRSLLFVLLAAVFVLYSGRITAQLSGTYPNKPVKIVVTLAPGGANDIIARVLAPKLTDQFKQPFVVENRAGGSGVPGADYAAKSAPDGYILLLANTSILAIQPHLYATLPFDPLRDFAPISILASSPSILVVHPSVEARSVKELIALARAHPGKFNYATPGNGTPFHLWTELIKKQTGTDMVHVPYKGAQPAFTDLISGRVQVMFHNLGDMRPHITSGKVRLIAQNGSKRSALLPEVPTMEEAGIRNVDSLSFFAMVVPMGTPKEIIATLSAEIAKAEKQIDVQQRLSEISLTLVGGSPEEAAAYIRNENARWASVIKESGAKVDH